MYPTQSERSMRKASLAAPFILMHDFMDRCALLDIGDAVSCDHGLTPRVSHEVLPRSGTLKLAGALQPPERSADYQPVA